MFTRECQLKRKKLLESISKILDPVEAQHLERTGKARKVEKDEEEEKPEKKTTAKKVSKRRRIESESEEEEAREEKD